MLSKLAQSLESSHPQSVWAIIPFTISWLILLVAESRTAYKLHGLVNASRTFALLETRTPSESMGSALYRVVEHFGKLRV